MVVGIALDALQDPEYRFTLGKNPKTYKAPKEDIMNIAQIWTNPQGKKVAIVPISIFQVEEVKNGKVN